MSGLLKPADVAEQLGFSRRHIVALAERGELPGYRIGTDWRFSQAALDAFLAARATGAPAAHANESQKPEASRSAAPPIKVDGFTLPDDYTPVFPELWANAGPTKKTSPQRH